MFNFAKAGYICLILLFVVVSARAGEIRRVSDIKNINASNLFVYYFDNGDVSQVTFFRGGIGDSGIGVGSGRIFHKGAFFYKNGELKELMFFKKGKIDKTKFYNTDGILEETQYYKNDKLFKGIIHYKDGSIEEDHFYKNGKKDKTEIFNKDGSLEQVVYYKKNKVYKIIFYENSILYQISYFNDKKHENGRPKSYKREYYNKMGNLIDTKFFK